MIDGAKHEIKGVSHDIDGAKCQAFCSLVKSNIVYLMRYMEQIMKWMG